MGPPDEDDLPIEKAAFVGAVVIGFLVIVALAVVFGTRSIEGTIEAQTLGILRANGIRTVEVDADGLEVTLAGAVRDETQIALARLIAESVDGVTAVDIENVVYVPPALDIELDIIAEPLVFDWKGSEARVTGTVSDEATLQTILAEASEIWATVDSVDLTVVEGLDSERDWLPAILSVVRRAGDDLDEGTVLANAGSSYVLVAGELETRSEQLEVRNDVQEILSALTFEFTSGLTVKEVPLPPDVPRPSTTTTEPPPEVVELQVTLDELIAGKVVEFESGRSVITQDGILLLDEVLEALRQFPDVAVEIGGHTDDIGTERDNLLLSRLRAAAVLAYLVDNGEDPTRFEVIGYGETQPVADNATAEGKARNRRIEFTALAE